MDVNTTSSETIEDRYSQIIRFFGTLIEYVDDIDAILKDIAQHYDSDRAYVFELSEDGKAVNNTYEWCKEGVAPQIDRLQNVPYESVAAWFDEFERSGAFYITSLNNDVEKNSLTYEVLEPQGIESLIATPIYKDDIIFGFVGVDNPRKNTEDIAVLKTVAGILYSEFSRKIAEKNKAIEDITRTQIEQDAELGEIRDIIASANMGLWRIEFIENEEPKMYADETMMELLGSYGQERTPELTYIDWFANITPDALSSVLCSVDKMKQGFFDENTYLWNHPTKGVRYVRCGGTSKPIPGGYSLQGYHYDVDDVVRKEQQHMKTLQKALNDKKEYYDTLGALGDLFYSMHVIDLANNKVYPFSEKGQVKEVTNHNLGAVDMMIHTMTAVTSEGYLTSALEFTDLTTLPDRMTDKKLISRELHGKNVGWFMASFITMEKDGNGKPTKVIYTTRVIDDEVKQKESLIHESHTDEMTDLLNRRAFEEKIYEHNDVPEEDNFIYVSMDANGLKQINDNIGHDAGDEMLIGVAQCMKRSMGQFGHLYRTGGDEFVAILFCNEQEIKSVLNDFDNMLEDWRGTKVDRISVSYGWISKHEMPGATTSQLGIEAEKRMYEAKADYYRVNGIDRRGQQEAHKVLCSLYTKILKINLSDDTYKIINMDKVEQSAEKGFAPTISEWLTSFGNRGMVHPDDLEEYFRLTDTKNMSEYFKQGKASLHIFYRRKYEDGFRRVMMEIVPAEDWSESNQTLFLYVKDIENSL